ncbi:MAG TPA: amidohydrolase family protein [Acidimicrobiia bacterium]|nr:amidohydrolase family protein [Acidimicrobiia bacterium]
MSRTPVPPLLRRRSSDEYAPLPFSDRDRLALARLDGRIPDRARAARTPLRTFVETRRATAATLRAINEAAGEPFYAVTADAEIDAEAANAAFGGGPDAVVVDVQTHLAMPSRLAGPSAEQLLSFLRITDPERWGDGIPPERLSAAEWAGHVFGGSETAVAVLTSTPGRPSENVVTNPEIASCREIVDRYAGTGRLLTHTIVHPNVPGELDAMADWTAELAPDGWKLYTMWQPPEWPDPMDGGWFLDDERVGLPFLERVRAVGPRVIAVHKGIGGPIPGASITTSSPRDVGPAARMFPDLAFLVYHSGYEPDPDGEEGPYPAGDAGRGVDRLVASLEQAGVGPGANVYAELGTTWFLMARKPREAAHVLGKLLRAVGPDRILWGTDCIWYGSPQPLIDAFRAFTIPERMQEEFGYPALTDDVKQRILATNAAAVYGIDLDAARAARGDTDWVGDARTELAAL